MSPDTWSSSQAGTNLSREESREYSYPWRRFKYAKARLTTGIIIPFSCYSSAGNIVFSGTNAVTREQGRLLR